KEKLERYGQTHLLKFYDELNEAEKAELLAQIESTDFSMLKLCESKENMAKRGKITPLAAMTLGEIEENKEYFYNTGASAIKAGKVGAVLLAGGMGTRLGSHEPKGMYNIGETKDVFIFERIIKNLMDIVDIAGSWIHLFVMTSEKNHKATTEFFEEKDYFGYNKNYITFFKQEMAPAADYNGKIYMESKSRMSTSPNGNGGWFISMYKSGVLDIVKREGIEWLNVFAVDNVLQRIADPVFVGAVISKGCAVGSKVVKKASPDEKVGVMCLEDGKPSIVEYYELTDELMNSKDENGEPSYNYGVILNYLFRVEDLEKIMKQYMPLHIVKKKIPYIDSEGQLVNPEEPNGYKFETLVLDMIHLMDSCLPFEVIREKEFAPIKNKTGVDSVETARELLRKNGVTL
ncbi:MAG: UTP--glucose-1-phosphate uridylyltransferase, partial [Lachnospiraceae bacterium]